MIKMRNLLLGVLALPLSMAWSAATKPSNHAKMPASSGGSYRRRGVPEILTTQDLYPEMSSTVLAATMGKEAEKARKAKEAEKAKQEKEKEAAEQAKAKETEKAKKARDAEKAKAARAKEIERMKKEREIQAAKDEKAREAEKAKREAEAAKNERAKEAESSEKEATLSKSAKAKKLLQKKKALEKKRAQKTKELEKMKKDAEAARESKAKEAEREAEKLKRELEAKKIARAKVIVKARKEAEARRLADARAREAAKKAAQQAAEALRQAAARKAEEAKTAAATEATKPVVKKIDKNQAIRRSVQLSLFAVLASAFLNLLGFTMAGPITPALGQHFGLKIGASFGSLTSAYPLGMLLGLFLWPPLSDRIGRKPVLAISLLGSGLGLAAQSYVIQSQQSLGLFLATRILTGSFAGASAVAKAYLADLGASQDRLPRFLAMRDAASTMAFIVGPLLGGLVYDMRKRIFDLLNRFTTVSATMLTDSASTSLAFVIAISSVASLLASLLVTVLVREIPLDELEAAQENQKRYRKKLIPDVIACPLGAKLWAGVATVCVISFLFNVGDSTFHAFFSAVMRDNLKLDTKSIGLAYTMFACVSFTVSATLSSKVVGSLGPVATCALGLAGTGAGLGLLSAQNAIKVLTLGAASLYYCGVPLYGPTIPTMLLRCVPPNKRGAVMGLDGAINTVARVVSPLLMGELYRRRGPSAAFGIASTASLTAAALVLYRRWSVIRESKEMGTKRKV